MMGLSIHEVLLLMLVVAVLSATGLWPAIIRGLRDLRGDTPPPSSSSSSPRGRTTNSDLCYKILGLTPSATWEEIERAYRNKAKLHHPDHGGDGDTMRALNEAYTLIKEVRGR